MEFLHGKQSTWYVHMYGFKNIFIQFHGYILGFIKLPYA